jgi:ribonucleoside-diphosphate reductase alpha chain
MAIAEIPQQIVPGATAAAQTPKKGLRLERYFTREGVHPYDEIDWELRDAIIPGEGGNVFEQRGVEVPKFWSATATNVVASKYFRGKLTSPEREWSVKQMVDRVVDRITKWGSEGGYFATDSDAQVFNQELKYLMVNQHASFNSPVWFNIGVEGVPAQASACFILSVDDDMHSILDWFKNEGVIFKGGSGSGINVSRIRSSKEQLSGGGYASGPVSFMRGADSVAGSIKSGGTTRRAAKMVVLDSDHPDIHDFIWCKAKEEKKAWALGEMGYDMSLNGEAWQSIQFQNANNSVRATDDFMRSALAGESWNLTARTDGQVLETVPGRDLLREIAEATWQCGDPGMQFDTTINDWHTSPVSGRINGSNPCAEYMSIDDSACNLASLNLMRFLHADGEFDVTRFARAVDAVFTAQEILVGFSDYPTPAITVNAKSHRQLGIGYANLGALLMHRGLAYDSNEGRAYAASITALMTGEAYAQSARLAAAVGPYEAYPKNKSGHDRVMEKHRAAAYRIITDLVPPTLLSAARQSWDDAVSLGKTHGYRNAQASVLAPTGTISFMMDCDTTGVEPDIALVKYKRLVGGGMLKLVNTTVPAALRRLGYTETAGSAITTYIEQQGTIEGAPGLREEHLAVFDCAFKPQNGQRSISHMGHIKMMGAVQPFISGAISKCVTAETLLSTANGLVRIGNLHSGERPDSFRSMDLGLASLDGVRPTDAFYYGGPREVLDVTLRSGHRVTGTPNHRLLIADMDEGLVWRRLDELKPGDHVAMQYGEDLWAQEPAMFTGFRPSLSHGSQKRVVVPLTMTNELAFFLGAYAAEGHVSRTNWTIRIANADEDVIARLQTLGEGLFGVSPRVSRDPGKCPSVELSSKTLVEFFDYLGCGDRASNKRIPDAVLQSPRSAVIAFLNGLSLDSYLPSGVPKWAICLDSSRLLDDLQAVLTNLGVVHSRVTKYNRDYDKYFQEVYASGRQAQTLVRLLDFPEAHKRARAAEITESDVAGSWADVVPGISGRDLYALLPKGSSGRSGRGSGVARRFSYLKDARTAMVSRASLDQVAAVPGIDLPSSLRVVLERNLHFSPIIGVKSAGVQDVFDVSVPVTHAFVGNGIVNHNTVNLPETATVDDVAEAYIEAWKHGVKAIAIYRDGSKKVQPLSVNSDASNTKTVVESVVTIEKIVEVNRPHRRRLADTRDSVTHKFSIEGHEGYITVGKFEDGTPGELFVTMAKEGSTLSGMMDAFATSISLLFQYGVPLSHLVEKFGHMRFEPSGWTGNPEIGMAKSIVDYVFRWLGHRFLTTEEKAYLGLTRTTELISDVPAQQARLEDSVRVAPPPITENFTIAASPSLARGMRLNSTPDAPPCPRCGWLTVRNGTCHKCENCGETTGCS